MEIYNLLTICVASLALLVSILAWITSAQSVRASIYDRRYEIYADAENFISLWMRHAYPDIGELSRLIGAWSRSHFLYGKDVTAYLREVWLDAVEANYLRQVASGEVSGDRFAAQKKCDELLLKHAEFKKLRSIFLKDLKVSNMNLLWIKF